jgi:hypothetical protein
LGAATWEQDGSCQSEHKPGRRRIKGSGQHYSRVSRAPHKSIQEPELLKASEKGSQSRGPPPNGQGGLFAGWAERFSAGQRSLGDVTPWPRTSREARAESEASRSGPMRVQF